MPPILKVVHVGDPVLRRSATPVTTDELRSSTVRRLIDLMRDTMRDALGCGLAAPQVGEPLQIVVIEDTKEYVAMMSKDAAEERQRVPVDFHVLVNPRLTVVDETPAEFLEGCLSVGGFMMLVPRALRVEVDALDEHGSPIRIAAAGWYARILQHEIDHLAGTLCIDRMVPRTLMTVENRERFWKKHTMAEIRAASVDSK